MNRIYAMSTTPSRGALKSNNNNKLAIPTNEQNFICVTYAITRKIFNFVFLNESESFEFEKKLSKMYASGFVWKVVVGE